MESVYILWHIRTDERLPGGEDVKLIGVYSSEENAIAAQKRPELLEGFRDTIEGFEIIPYKVNKDSWTSGFVTGIF